MRESRSIVNVGVLLDENKSRYLLEVFSQQEFQSGFHIVFIDLAHVRAGPMFRLLRILNRLKRVEARQLEVETEAQAILRVCRSAKIHKLVAIDNKLELLATLTNHSTASKIECHVIQMSTNPIHRDGFRKTTARKVAVTMYSWGAAEQDTYVRNGLTPTRFITIGSAKHELAKRLYPDLGELKRWDICLVSMFASQTRQHDKPSESVIHERETMPKLVSLLAPIVSKHDLKMIVAVRAGQQVLVHSSEDEELDFYKTTLGDLASLSDFDQPYASYVAASASRLVVGRTSAMLTEYLGTNSKVLFVNPTGFRDFNAPDEMPFQLNLPTSLQLETMILKLLKVADSEYEDAVRAARQKYCAKSEDCFRRVADELRSPMGPIPSGSS